MKVFHYALILFLAVAACRVSAQERSKEGVAFRDLTLEEALVQAAQEKKFVFADIYAVWCGPCKYMDRHVLSDKEVGNYVNEHFVAVKFDGDKPDGEAMCRQYRVKAYPTYLVIDSEGDLVGRLVGVNTASNFVKQLGKLIENRRKK